MQKKNYYYNNIKGLLKSGIKLDYSPEQISEIIKCKNNVEYFLEKYVKIINQDKGIVPFKLYDYQKELINLFQTENRVISLQARQSGKCIHGESSKVNIIKKPIGFKKLLLTFMNFCGIYFNDKFN